MELTDDVMYKGRRLVSRALFRKLANLSLPTMAKYINNGELQIIHIDGNSPEYIDYEIGMILVKKIRRNPGRRASKITNIPVESNVTAVAEPSVSEPEVKTENRTMVDLSKFDREKYKDCIDYDGNFDYDKLKDRLTAETYEFKLDKERGMHIPKNDIVLSAKAIAQIIRTNLDAVPARYVSSFIALAESMTGYNFSDEQKTEFRNRLKSVSPQIMLSIQSEIRNMTEE